jgi:hypothetical protein
MLRGSLSSHSSGTLSIGLVYMRMSIVQRVSSSGRNVTLAVICAGRVCVRRRVDEREGQREGQGEG